MSYDNFDYKDSPHENESWYQFLVRKLSEERLKNEKRKSLGNN